MRKRNASISTLLKVIKLPILWTRRYVEPASWEKKDKEVADFVNNAIFEEMEWSRSSTLSEILTMLDFGFCLFEQVYKVDENGMITLRKLAFRKQETIEKWETEKWSPGVTQSLPTPKTNGENKGETNISIPAAKLLRFTFNQEWTNYEWTSLLRPIYQNYFAIDKLYRYDLIRAERASLPVPTIKLPKEASKTDRAEAAKIVKNIRTHEQSGVVLPSPDRSFEYTQVHGKDGVEILNSVKVHHEEIFRMWLAQFLLLWSAWSWWSYSLSEDQSDLFLLSLQYIAKYVCDIMNEYIVKRLVSFNFDGVEEMPKLCFEKIWWIDYKKLTEAIKLWTDWWFITTDFDLESFIRTQMWLPKKQETEEEEQGPGKKEKIKKEVTKKDDEDNDDEDEADADEIEKESKKASEHTCWWFDKEYMSFSELFDYDLILKLQKEVKTADDLADLKKKGLKFNNRDLYSRRPLTFAERKVNRRSIEKKMKEFEQVLKDALDQYSEKMQKDLLIQVKKAVDKNDIKAIWNISSKHKWTIAAILTDIQKQMFEFWKQLAAWEIGKKTPLTNNDIRAAMKIQNDAVIAKLTSDIDNAAKRTVVELTQKNGANIKNVTSAAAVAAVSQVTDKIIQKATANLNTLAITGAINTWRTTVFERYPEEVHWFQYSAILDGKTTNICLSLDGRVVKAWSREYYDYSPPRHHNCRSIWVAILKTEIFKPKISWIPSSIPAAATIDLHTRLQAPVMLPNSPSIRVVKDEIEQRKEKVKQYKASGKHTKRIAQHEKQIAVLQKALKQKFYEEVKDYLKHTWIEFKK